MISFLGVGGWDTGTGVGGDVLNTIRGFGEEIVFCILCDMVGSGRCGWS